MSYTSLTPHLESASHSLGNQLLNGALHPTSGGASSILPALPWSSPERLTISFAPDGTRISNYQSNLFDAFKNLLTADQLETQILSAFQQWSNNSAINIGYQSDSGLQFGISGPVQGDSRVGDIRVGAIPMGGDVFAVAIKHDSVVAGTWAGDLIFNSNKIFANIGEFYSVALHEAGHILGLEHSTNPAAAMFPRRLNNKLVAADVLELQRRYGFRRLDENDIGNKNNNDFNNSTRIKNSGSLMGRVPLIVYGDLHRKTDVDYFDLPPLHGYTGPIKFELVTAGISLTRAKLNIYNESEQLIQTVSGSGFRGSRISVTIPQAVEGETYFARVEAADQTQFSIGSYAIKATLEANVQASPALVESVLVGKYSRLKQSDVQGIFLNPQQFFFQAELLLNDSFANAENLVKAVPKFEDGQQFQAIGSLSYFDDRDFYRVVAPAQIRSNNTMTVVLNTMEAARVVPRLTVFDSNRVFLPSNVLVNGNGQLTIQVANVVPNQTYFVRVTADLIGDRFDSGNYQFSVRFDQVRQTLETLGQGTLSSASPETRRNYHSLYVAETQMFHLALSANQSSPRSMAQVWVTIYDPLGRPVFRTLTVPGQTRTAKSIILRPGSYTIFTSLASAANAPLTTLSYTLSGIGITDPIGPSLVKPANKPFKPVSPTDPTYVYPGGQLSLNKFLVVGGNTGITPTNLLREPNFVDANAWYWYTSWLTENVPNL